MSDSFPMMARVVPESAVGTARVEHFTVSEQDAKLHNMRCSFRPGGRVDMIEPGTYAKLLVNSRLVMSDTGMERFTNNEVLWEARGRVLIGGLGLGMVVHALAAKREVTHITVVEVSRDVIRLVVPTLPPGVTVVHADILTWQPPKGVKWDTIYFDIWPDVSEDNLPQMATLHRRFARRRNPGGWLGSWRREELLARRRGGW